MDGYYYYDEFYNPATATFVSILGIIFTILLIISLWKIFEKAGEAGWKSIIPIYNLYIQYKIVWGSGWMFLLLLIPIVNVIVSIMTAYKLAKVFGKGIAFALGLIFFPYIFQLILGFGQAKYLGVQYQ